MKATVAEVAPESLALKLTGPPAAIASQLYVSGPEPVAAADNVVVPEELETVVGLAVNELITGGKFAPVALKLMPLAGAVAEPIKLGENV